MKLLKILFRLMLILVVINIVGYFILRKAPISLDVLKDKYTNEYSQFMDLQGMDVHYRIEGQGEPIVLIHGTGASLQTFDQWTDTLKKKYQVIRMDIPGFGLTGPSPTEDYSLQYYVDFIQEFTERLHLSHFVLGGNSLGGEIAWKYAYYHPEKVKALLLLDPAGSPIQDYNIKLFSAFTLSMIPIISTAFSDLDPGFLTERTLKQAYEKDELITPEKVEMYNDMALRDGNRKSFVQRVRQVRKDPILQPGKVETPTLLLWGKQDALLPLVQLDGFKGMKNMQSIIYDGVGHTPQDEVAVESVHDAMKFLDSLSGQNSEEIEAVKN
ncbi:MAG: alpha/beta hydrolase [Chitinophagales bacterium]|nr:alpha/beta hydrolase [Chitinophagales bacterium]